VLLMHQAIWRLEQGELRLAEAIIQHIPPSEDRETALALFAAAQARKGDHAGARRTLKQLPAGFVQSFHLLRQRALEALLQAGLLEEGARLCIEASLPAMESSDAPRSVLDAYRRAGRWGDALNWARQLPSEWREFALIVWAAHALQQGDPDPTRRLNAQEQTPALLLRLAHIAQGRNMLQQANRWRTEALQRLKSLPANERDLLFHSAAIELARMGDYERAESLIKQIKPRDSLRNWTARQAAYSALEQGNLNRAQRFAEMISAQNIRIRVYARIAARYYQAGDRQTAQAIIDRLVQQMQTQRHTGLVNYAVDMTDGVCRPVIEEDAYPLVQPLLRQLEEEIAKAPSADARKFILHGVLSCYTKAGDLERAFHLAAQQRTRKEQAEALLSILHVYAWER
jgi:thioredoxin-like negative regulator of GroEL